MLITAKLLIIMVAAVQAYLLAVGMFLWERPLGLRLYEMPKSYASATREMAANQGLYHGFLGAGLIWGLGNGDLAVQRFFLGCVLVAGLYAAFTYNGKMLLWQAAPALLALSALWFAA